MLTLERASELVAALREAAAPDDEIAARRGLDLFRHFGEFFELNSMQIVDFTVMCGYLTPANVLYQKDNDDGNKT